jgi:hypothetical protein
LATAPDTAQVMMQGSSTLIRFPSGPVSSSGGLSVTARPSVRLAGLGCVGDQRRRTVITAEEKYDQIAETMESEHGARRAKMFGMPGLKVGKTAFAGLFGNDMVFKLGEGTAAHTKAMKIEGAQIWDPSGRDRPFKDWVQVPSASAGQWDMLAVQAFEHALANP